MCKTLPIHLHIQELRCLKRERQACCRHTTKDAVQYQVNTGEGKGKSRRYSPIEVRERCMPTSSTEASEASNPGIHWTIDQSNSSICRSKALSCRPVHFNSPENQLTCSSQNGSQQEDNSDLKAGNTYTKQGQP
eukprot:1148073-Pelagomonas_calceolata.AAC.22